MFLDIILLFGGIWIGNRIAKHRASKTGNGGYYNG
jgi:hypothetical protein